MLQLYDNNFNVIYTDLVTHSKNSFYPLLELRTKFISESLKIFLKFMNLTFFRIDNWQMLLILKVKEKIGIHQKLNFYKKKILVRSKMDSLNSYTEILDYYYYIVYFCIKVLFLFTSVKFFQYSCLHWH